MTRSAFKATFLLLALCELPLAGCSHTYSADSISATVVDADTKQPIEGVVVIAHWEMKSGMESGNIAGEVMILETVSDGAGKFHFPAWGPKRVDVGLSNAHLTHDDPELILFKSGYRLEILANEVRQSYGNARRTSDWNSKTIQLKTFEGDLQAYASDLGMFFPDYAFSGNCNWRQIPLTIAAMADQTRIFRAAKIHTGNFYTFLLSNEGSCGSVEALVREHRG